MADPLGAGPGDAGTSTDSTAALSYALGVFAAVVPRLEPASESPGSGSRMTVFAGSASGRSAGRWMRWQRTVFNPGDTTFEGRVLARLPSIRSAVRASAEFADYARAIELDPDYAGAYYNTACAYGLQGDGAQACEWLAQAIVLDAKHRETAAGDSDFDNVRDATCMQGLLDEVDEGD